MIKAKLGDICNIVSGGTPSRSRPEFWDGGTIPWVKISDIKSKYIDSASESITKSGLDNSAAKLLKKGTILYTIFATLGEVGILNIDACTNQAIVGITAKDPDIIKTDYLYYFLKSKKRYVDMTGRGVAQNNINLSILRDFEVTIPPVETQEKILSVLDKTQSIISCINQRIAKTDEFVKTRFVEMFGEPGVDNHGWGLRALGTACLINPKRGQDSQLLSDLDVSVVPMPAVSEHGEIDTTEVKKYNDVKAGLTYFEENDVLFAKITPCMENGKGAVAKGLCNGIGFGSTEFHVLRPIDGITNSVWIYMLTVMPKFRKEAAEKMTGSAGQRRVPASFLKNYQVAVPPIALQNKFATYVIQTEKIKSAMQQSINNTQLLFDSLMQEYFG